MRAGTKSPSSVRHSSRPKHSRKGVPSRPAPERRDVPGVHECAGILCKGVDASQACALDTCASAVDDEHLRQRHCRAVSAPGGQRDAPPMSLGCERRLVTGVSLDCGSATGCLCISVGHVSTTSRSVPARVSACVCVCPHQRCVSGHRGFHTRVCQRRVYMEVGLVRCCVSASGVYGCQRWHVCRCVSTAAPWGVGERVCVSERQCPCMCLHQQSVPVSVSSACVCGSAECVYVCTRDSVYVLQCWAYASMSGSLGCLRVSVLHVCA